MILTAPGFNVSTSAPVPVSIAPDGCPIVHGPVTITSHDADLAVKNHRGYAEALSPLPAGPIQLVPGDVLILGRHKAPGENRDAYMGAPGRSAYSRMAAIACVQYPKHGDPFRVMGIGDGPLVRILRQYPIGTEQVDGIVQTTEILPSVAEIPDDGIVEELERIFGSFCGEVHSQWGTDTVTPDMQHPGYGTYLASYVSQAMVVLCSKLPVARKVRLATLMVQWGLDLAGAFADGRFNQPSGGHMQGRKALVILAGHLLGIPQMTDVDAVNRNWQETTAYFTKPVAWWFGWDHGWNCFSEGDGTYLAKPPSQWTRIDPPIGRSDVYRMTGYYPAVMGCQVGTALGMKLMGLTRQMGASFIGNIEQWMQGPPVEALAELDAANVRLPWGEDYCVNGRAGLCAQAWRKVFA